MKKALSFLLVLSMLLGMAVLAPIGAAAEEEVTVGTVAADYKPEGTAVATAEEFAAMDPAGKYYLSADITLSETYTTVFTGTFDGNGHTVTISAPLFQTVNGTVCNLKIEGAIRIEAGTTIDGNIGAAVANRACYGGDASFYNIANRATLTSFATGMAGIVGRGGNGTNDTYVLTIKDCVNYAPITTDFGSANRDSGGMLGYFVGNHASGVMQLVIENCVNYGTINACGRPGGIIGVCDSSVTIKNCVNNGAVQAIDNYAGGIAARLGDNYNGTADAAKNAEGMTILVENCVNNGDISYDGGKATQVAGICGYTSPSKSMTFRNCVNNGNLSAVYKNKNASFGGILAAGDNLNDATKNVNGTMLFENCVNNGNINVPDGWASNAYVGGIAAYVQSHATAKFINCTNKGDLTNRGAAGGARLQNHTGGIAGYTRYKRVFTDCYNYGNIIGNVNMTAGTVSVGGIVAYVARDAKSEGTSEFTRCGNMGDVTGGRSQAGGLVGYHWGSDKVGANFNYCFNTGDVTGSGFVSGLLAYINSSRVTVKYCYVAGKMTCTTDATAVPSDGAVKAQVEYTFEEGGKNYYFYAPLAGTATITGTTVKIDTVDAITAVSDGDTVVKNKIYTFTHGSDTYLFKANGDGVVHINGTTVNVGTGNAIYVDKINSLDIPVFDHRINTRALFWSNNMNSTVDLSLNVIAENCAGLDYVSGASNALGLVGMTTAAAAKYDIGRFATGEVADTLNKLSGTDTYRQNLLASIFDVDAFPTTEDTHAKVIESAGSYTNLLFEMNPDITPATGDATVYVVIALGVSAVALAGLVIAKKKKVRD